MQYRKHGIFGIDGFISVFFRILFPRQPIFLHSGFIKIRLVVDLCDPVNGIANFEVCKRGVGMHFLRIDRAVEVYIRLIGCQILARFRIAQPVEKEIRIPAAVHLAHGVIAALARLS